MQEFKVGQADAGKRTDVFVAENFPDFSRSSLKSLFGQKLVKVNSKTEEPGDKLKKGDLVSVDVSTLNHNPQELDLPVIYEDNDVIVVDKPSGVLTHSKGALNTEATFASFLKPRITDNSLTGNRAGVAHRLDRLTSGVIIGARTLGALKHLQKQFSTRKAAKTYLAVVESVAEPPMAIIDAAIGRNPARPQTFKVIAGGKPAQTE
jgi:23S rRNA pseudouridine1911/1915/1917 synthase